MTLKNITLLLCKVILDPLAYYKHLGSPSIFWFWIKNKMFSLAIHGFFWNNLNRPESKTTSDLGIDGRKKIKEMWFEGVKWIHLALDRDQWQICVKVILNFWVHREL
jgi:hypothetical protein